MGQLAHDLDDEVPVSRLAHQPTTVIGAVGKQVQSGRSSPQNATLDVLRRAFEMAPVIFIDENGQGLGVRLRKDQA
jgi:hypothetical protein